MSTELGPYELVKQLPLGCLGEVFVARPVGRPDARPRVLKMVNPFLFYGADIDPEWLQDIVTQNARLTDPRIARIDETGQARGEYFVAMDYVKGDTLRGLLHRAERAKTPMPLPVALWIAAEVAGALDAAHRAAGGGPVCHLNLTPRNVMLRFDTGGVLVTDFGLGRLKFISGRSSAGTVTGKYLYLAPEQVSDNSNGPWTDIFCLGGLLYEMVTGAPMFRRKGDYETVRAITECAVSPPSAANGAVPAGVDRIVLNAMARKPTDRTASAGEMRAALLEQIAATGSPDAAAECAAFVQRLYADYIARHAGDAL